MDPIEVICPECGGDLEHDSACRAINNPNDLRKQPKAMAARMALLEERVAVLENLVHRLAAALVLARQESR